MNKKKTESVENTSVSSEESKSTPFIFPSPNQEPYIDLELQLAVCKLVTIFRYSGKNSGLSLRPKLV